MWTVWHFEIDNIHVRNISWTLISTFTYKTNQLMIHWSWPAVCWYHLPRNHFTNSSGAHNGNLWNWKFFFVLTLILMIYQVTILHMSRQLSCRGMCEIVTSSATYFLCDSNMNFLWYVDYELLNSLWDGSMVAFGSLRGYEATLGMIGHSFICMIDPVGIASCLSAYCQ